VEKHLKKIFLITTIIGIIIFLLSGCVTKLVWTDKKKSFKYNENIISFYTNMQKEEIVFIGEKYHYIFNKDDEETKNLFELLNKKKFLKLRDRDFEIYYSRISSNNNRKIRFGIKIPFNKNILNKEENLWLSKYIYETQYKGYDKEYYKKKYNHMTNIDFRIEGMRYYAKAEVNTKVIKLKTSIPLTIVDYQVDKTKKKSIFYKVAMTPLSVTSDVFLVLSGLYFLSLGIPSDDF